MIGKADNLFARNLFDYEGKQYISIIDYYSKFVEYKQLKNIMPENVIKILKVTFSGRVIHY